MKKYFKFKKGGDIFLLLLSFIITLGTAYIASSATRNASEIYKGLEKPFFAPPAWVFPIVWTVLYILMAYALYRVWVLKKSGICTKKAVIYYFIQLALNFLWPILYFGLRLRGIAFVELILLVIFIVLTTIEFFKKDKLAGKLFIPYLIWSIYALALNFATWYLNA